MPSRFYENHPLLIIIGHYGSGKTNLALNIALQLHREGRTPRLVDLDIVNPYFRSTDFQDLANREGLLIVGPVFGNTNLDAPSLSPEIGGAIEGSDLQAPVIVDVGGDPDGARALARYAPTIERVPNKLVVVVVNTRRPETQSVEDNLLMFERLSYIASLKIDGIVGNTHLAEYTTLDTINESLPLLKELSDASGLPLVAVTIPAEVPSQEDDLFMPVERLVKTPWQ